MGDDAIGQQQCRLLAGPAAAFAQISLALVVLAALLLRRARERPRRDGTVFLFDVSKQFVSGGAAHLSGLAFSVAAAAAAAAAGGGGGGGSFPERRRPSECGWYLVLFSVDTVAGSALAILLHRSAVAAAAKKLAEGTKVERLRLSPPPAAATGTSSSSSLPQPPGPPLSSRIAAAVARCGNYGSPPSFDLFLPQLLEWTLAVVAARLVCGFSVLALRYPLSAVAAGVDGLFSSSPSLELFSVMLAGPVLMNAGQALVQDAVLRAEKRAAASASASASGAGAGAGAVVAAAGEEASVGGGGEEEGAELLPSPPGSSSASSFSRYP